MRQILVLGLLAVLGWWLYTDYLATPADASGVGSGDGSGDGNAIPVASGGAGGATGAPVSLDGMFGGAAKTNAAADGTAGPAAEPSQGQVERLPLGGVALDVGNQSALTQLLTQIAAGEVAAIDLGWRTVARGDVGAATVQRLHEALAPPTTGDFAARLKALGGSNAFLHSPRGREQALQTMQAALSLPDADAVAAGSKLLGLCLRGRIEQRDTAARELVDQAYNQYRPRANNWLCNSGNVAGARSYTIRSGDSLNRIARKFRKEGLKVEEGTLAVLNRIHNKNSIKAGQRIKIPVDPVHAVLEKRSFGLALYVGDHLLRLYWVGHGREDKTPVTTFTVGVKQPRPQWTSPDGNVYPYGNPKNILGEYWISLNHEFHTGFGIHGTPMPETIGTMSSDGCVRMLAADVAELFEILPRGAAVEVRASGAP